MTATQLKRSRSFVTNSVMFFKFHPKVFCFYGEWIRVCSAHIPGVLLCAEGISTVQLEGKKFYPLDIAEQHMTLLEMAIP